MNTCVHLLFLLFFPFTAWAEEAVLRVGVAPGEPFVILNQDQFDGIAVFIWKKLAEELNIKYEFIPLSEHIDEDIKMLADGKVDVLIGPIIPTKEREKLADFMRPFYLNQVGVVVPLKKISFFSTIYDVFVGPFGKILLCIFLLFILYIHIFWFFERKKGYMDIPGTGYLTGIGYVFWLHTLNISFPRPPTSTFTRVFRFIWYATLLLLFSTFTATLTSSLTVALSNSYFKYDRLSDFSGKAIAAVINAAPYDLAVEAGLNVVSVQSRDEGINLVLNGQVSGFADYLPIADYYLRKHQLTGQLVIANAIIAQNTFAFALPIDSPLRHKLNLQFKILQTSGEIKALCSTLLGEKQAKNCEI